MPRQSDEVFEDQFLASLHDHFNTWGADDDFYLQLAREIGGRVFDLGCGTGMLACRIAQEGLSVTGADPAEGMLRVARSRQGTEQVSWIKADGQALRLSLRFDLIYMTGYGEVDCGPQPLTLCRSESSHAIADCGEPNPDRLVGRLGPGVADPDEP
jgi:SAM-dependent methyltransferase